MKVGQGKALKNKWIAKQGAGFIRTVCLFLVLRVTELTG